MVNSNVITVVFQNSGISITWMLRSSYSNGHKGSKSNDLKHTKKLYKSFFESPSNRRFRKYFAKIYFLYFWFVGSTSYHSPFSFWLFDYDWPLNCELKIWWWFVSFIRSLILSHLFGYSDLTFTPSPSASSFWHCVQKFIRAKVSCRSSLWPIAASGYSI